MTHEQDIFRTHRESVPVIHLKAILFGILFSSPFWAFLIYVMVRFA